MRRAASLLLVLLALAAAGCVRELKHSPDAAATAAEGFVRALIVEKDAAKAFEMTDPTARGGRTASDLKKSAEQSPGYGQVTEVTATDYQPVPGQPAMDIFLSGRAGQTTYYYVVRVSGTMETGYKPAHLGASAQPIPGSSTRQSLH